jgi:hypothetical protein
MARWAIPEPLPVDRPMQTLDSAVSSGFLTDGRFCRTVQHGSLPGVVPAMRLWFLERVDRQTTWHGLTASGGGSTTSSRSATSPNSSPRFLPELYRQEVGCDDPDPALPGLPIARLLPGR